MFKPSIRPRHTFMVSALLLAACSSGMEDKPAAEVKDANASATPADSTSEHGDLRELAADPEVSTIGFRGAKVTGHHDGGFKSFTGIAKLDGDQPKQVSFEVQMDSIYSDNEKLTNHLKSDEFFDVEKIEISKFQSTKITAKADGEYTHVVEGTLDMHGKQKTIAFPAKITVGDDQVRGSSEFTINRKDFGIVYPGMPDDLIKDEVLLKLDLVFPTA